MRPSDYVGMTFFLIFGGWWLFVPRSVVRFYSWFHGEKLKEKWGRNPPSTFVVRLVGLLWITLVLAVWVLRGR